MPLIREKTRLEGLDQRAAAGRLDLFRGTSVVFAMPWPKFRLWP